MKPAQSHTPAQNLRFALRVIWLLTRGLAGVFAGLLALVVAAVLFLPRFIDSHRVKVALEAQLQQILRRPVGIGGVILTPQGVKLNGVRIEAKDGTGRAILESQFALVTVKLRPLLHKRLELNEVKLVAPTIHLWRGLDGQWNVADLFSSTAPVQAAPAGRFALPVSLYADNTVIENGELQVEDALRDTRYAIKRFNLALHKFDLERPFTFALKFQDQNRFGEREVDAAVALEGSMSLAALDWRQAYLRAEKLEVQVNGQTIRGSGGVTGLPLAAIDADLALPALDQAQWELYLKRKLDLQIPRSRWKLKARLAPERRLFVDRIEVSAGPLSARGAGMVDFSTGGPRVDADLFVADFPLPAAAGFSAALAPYGLKGVLSAEASVTGGRDKLVVHRGRARWRDVGVTLKRATVARGAADVAVSDDFDKLALAFSQGEVAAFSNLFSGIDLALNLKGKDLKVDKLALRWSDSRLRLKGQITNLADPKKVEIAGNIDRLRWESAQSLVNTIVASISTRAAAAQGEDGENAPRQPWVRTFKYAIPRRLPDSVGHIRIADVAHKNFNFKNAEIMWDLRGVTRSLKRVGGDIRVGFGPGGVSDIQAVQQSNKFLRVVFLPYVYMHKMNSLSVLSVAPAYPKSLDFNRIEGQYMIANGLVTTKFFHVDSPQLLAYADGTADFGKESVDMSILTRLTSYRAPLPEWWVDELGRPAIGFRVKGDLNKPDLEPRLHKIEADEIEKSLAEGRTRAKARFESIERLETP